MGGIVGGFLGGSSDKKASKQMKKQLKFQRQQAELQAMRQRMETVRTGRSAYAEAQQAAENQGVATSSVAGGGQGSIFSQMTDNVSFLDQWSHLTQKINKAGDKAMKYRARGNMWRAIGSAVDNVAQAAAGMA
jgi:hypothetical protein